MTIKLFALAMLVPAPLLAQAGAQGITRATFESRIGSEFGEMDGNKDGSLSKAEVEAWQTRTAATIATARNKAIFARSLSGSGCSQRQTMISGWMPRLVSSRTECWVGLVFSSPAAAI